MNDDFEQEEYDERGGLDFNPSPFQVACEEEIKREFSNINIIWSPVWQSKSTTEPLEEKLIQYLYFHHDTYISRFYPDTRQWCSEKSKLIASFGDDLPDHGVVLVQRKLDKSTFCF